MKERIGMYLKFRCLKIGEEGCKFWNPPSNDKLHCMWSGLTGDCENKKAQYTLLKEYGYERVKM